MTWFRNFTDNQAGKNVGCSLEALFPITHALMISD